MKAAILTLAGLTFLTAFPLPGADERQLALALQAQAEFDRVEAAVPAPQLRETIACIQSQAAVLPLTLPQERPLILFRKGYCALAQAVLTDSSAQFGSAASIFDQALDAWQAHESSAKPKLPVPPAPSLLRVYAAVARLRQSSDPDSILTELAHLEPAVDHPICTSVIMPEASCLAALQIGNAWLGWIAMQSSDPALTRRQLALQRFSAAHQPAWLQWLQGADAFRAANYPQAANDYAQALTNLQKSQLDPASPISARLNPRPDLAAMLTDLGEAQLLAHTSSAIETLDAAVRADPSRPRALYLRARAKEAAAQTGAALADFDLASRTAFAAHPGQSSGEAHFYQGILLYHRGNWSRAEDEFAGALNFNIPTPMRADAAAWRHLAAVAGGSCGASREYLEQSLTTVSPDFPFTAARSVLAACGASPVL